ncbi:hypothetical protein [Brevibacterium linens]|uniref:hypothetical protein n=1 Tax=Brevibacterium linens TaxID=1703 RepID=UPI000FCCB8DA|nr:hypothetical protein [Brevibacterium linens]
MAMTMGARCAAVFAAVGLVVTGCSEGADRKANSAPPTEGSDEVDVLYPSTAFGEPEWQEGPLTNDFEDQVQVFDDRVVRWGGSKLESRNPDGTIAWQLDLAEHFSDDDEEISDVRRMAGGKLGLNTEILASHSQTFLLDAESGDNLEKVEIPDGWRFHFMPTRESTWGLSFQYKDDDQKNLVVNSDGSTDTFEHLQYATGKSAVTLEEEFGNELIWHPTGGRSGTTTTYRDFAGSTERAGSIKPRVVVDEDIAIIRSGEVGESATEMIDLSKGERLAVIKDCYPDEILRLDHSFSSPNGEFVAAGNAVWKGSDPTCLSDDGGTTAMAQAVYDDGTVIAIDYSGHEDTATFNPAKQPGMLIRDGQRISEFEIPEGEKKEVAPTGTLSNGLAVYAGPGGSVVAVPRK